MGRRFGGARAAAMHDYMREFAARFGITDMVQPGHLPNTRRILAAAEYARDHGDLDAFRQAAMNAYWRRGENLQDEGVVREIAAAAGVDPNAAVAAMDDDAYLARVDDVRRESINAGVTGIPTFFIGDDVVVGCQPYETLAAAVERAGGRRRRDASTGRAEG